MNKQKERKKRSLGRRMHWGSKTQAVVPTPAQLDLDHVTHTYYMAYRTEEELLRERSGNVLHGSFILLRGYIEAELIEWGQCLSK